jgi:hypothetical protein
VTRLAGSSKLLRAMNESATLALLLEKGTLTRAELRELTGLSKPTTSDVLRTLTDIGLATVIGHTSGGPGPNAEIYAINPTAAYVVALSLRDTTVAAQPAIDAALCDLAGTVLVRGEYDVDPSDPLEVVESTVASLCRKAGVDPSAVNHVQLGVPGSYDARTDTIRHIDVTGWGRPGLLSDLAGRLDLTVWADNDVNLAAIAERHRGVAAGSSSFALLWFGAGLGCAIDLGDSCGAGYPVGPASSAMSRSASRGGTCRTWPVARPCSPWPPSTATAPKPPRRQSHWRCPKWTESSSANSRHASPWRSRRLRRFSTRPSSCSPARWHKPAAVCCAIWWKRPSTGPRRYAPRSR